MYGIGEVSEITGLSTRTLRFYQEKGLIKPHYISDNGYRYFSTEDIKKLHNIMLYRKMDVPLEKIAGIINKEGFSLEKDLEEHLKILEERLKNTKEHINIVKKSIRELKGEIKMEDKERFEAFKKEKLEENERKYGKEIREKYGEETVEKSNKHFLNLSEEKMKEAEKLSRILSDNLKLIIEKGITDLKSEEALKVFNSHRDWLKIMNPSYTEEYHRAMGDLYVNDERFGKYYESSVGKNAANILKEIIYYHTEKGNK